MSASQYRYSCDELGACQGRATPCSGCIKPRQSPLFAPGAIAHHTSRHRRALLRWLRRAVVLMAFTSTAAFLAGLIHGALQ